MQTIDHPTTRDIAASLGSTICPACGRRKQPRRTFCGGCYHRLDRSYQMALYKGVGAGYEQAVARALVRLGAKFIPDVPMVEQIDTETGEVTLVRSTGRGEQRPTSPAIPRSYGDHPHPRERSFGVPGEGRERADSRVNAHRDDKPADGRRTWQQALADGEAFRALFPAECYERWEIAGSVRRRSAGGAKDVEHVVIPRFGDVPDGDSLFAATVRVNLLWHHLDALVAAGRASKHLYTIHRKDGTGDGVAHRWGERYRGVDFGGFNHEVFTADADNFGSVLAIRTGPGEYSKGLVLALQRNGYCNMGGYVHSKRSITCPCGWAGAWDGLVWVEQLPAGTPPKAQLLGDGNDRAGVCPRCARADGLEMALVPAPVEQTYFSLCNVRWVEPAQRGA